MTFDVQSSEFPEEEGNADQLARLNDLFSWPTVQILCCNLRSTVAAIFVLVATRFNIWYVVLKAIHLPFINCLKSWTLLKICEFLCNAIIILAWGKRMIEMKRLRKTKRREKNGGEQLRRRGEKKRKQNRKKMREN